MTAKRRRRNGGPQSGSEKAARARKRRAAGKEAAQTRKWRVAAKKATCGSSELNNSRKDEGRDIHPAVAVPQYRGSAPARRDQQFRAINARIRSFLHRGLFALLASSFRTRGDLQIELLALRHRVMPRLPAEFSMAV